MNRPPNGQQHNLQTQTQQKDDEQQAPDDTQQLSHPQQWNQQQLDEWKQWTQQLRQDPQAQEEPLQEELARNWASSELAQQQLAQHQLAQQQWQQEQQWQQWQQEQQQLAQQLKEQLDWGTEKWKECETKQQEWEIAHFKDALFSPEFLTEIRQSQAQRWASHRQDIEQLKERLNQTKEQLNQLEPMELIELWSQVQQHKQMKQQEKMHGLMQQLTLEQPMQQQELEDEWSSASAQIEPAPLRYTNSTGAFDTDKEGNGNLIEHHDEEHGAQVECNPGSRIYGSVQDFL